MPKLTYLPAALLAFAVTVAAAIGLLGPSAPLDPLTDVHATVVAPAQSAGAGAG